MSYWKCNVRAQYIPLFENIRQPLPLASLGYPDEVPRGTLHRKLRTTLSHCQPRKIERIAPWLHPQLTLEYKGMLIGDENKLTKVTASSQKVSDSSHRFIKAQTKTTVPCNFLRVNIYFSSWYASGLRKKLTGIAIGAIIRAKLKNNGSEHVFQ